MQKILNLFFAVVFLGVLIVGCGSHNTGYEDDIGSGSGASGHVTPPATESKFIVLQNGSFVAGSKPRATDGGPVLESVTGMFSLVNGGYGQFTLKFSYPAGLAKVKDALVMVETVRPEPKDGGYQTVAITDPTTGATELSIFVKEDITLGALNLSFAVRDVDGKVSNWLNKRVVVILTGTGDVKISLTFDQTEDLDLHVWEPKPDGSAGGEHIYYAHRTSATGGQLDLDSNPACSIDGKNNENIFWPTGRAPHGIYRAQMNYWEHCEVVTTFPVNWIIAVIVKDQTPQIFTGVWENHDQTGEGNPLAYRPSPAIEFTY